MEHTKGSLNKDLAAWLVDFEKQQGRKLKVLHIGNIAANGFLNAKFMRRVGIEADVLCYDYYHIMAYPEWEELAIHDDYKQDILPQFSKQDRAGYARPKWFAQGPFAMSSAYLQAKNSGNERRSNKLWYRLNEFLFNEADPIGFVYRHWLEKQARGFKDILNIFLKSPRACLYLVKFYYPIIIRRLLFIFTKKAEKKRLDKLNVNYTSLFPERNYRLTWKSVKRFLQYERNWSALFDTYDVVQC